MLVKKHPLKLLWQKAQKRSFTPPNILDFISKDPIYYDWTWKTWWPILFPFCFAHGIIAVTLVPANAQVGGQSNPIGGSIDVKAIDRAAQLSSQDVAQAFDLFWLDTLPGWMKIIQLSLAFVAIIGIGWLAIHLAKKADSTGSFPWETLVLPAVLVLLVTGTDTSTRLARSVRDVLNSMNDQVLSITGANSTIEEAKALQSYPAVMSAQIKQCEGVPPGELQGVCFNAAAQVGSDLLEIDRQRFGNQEWIDDRQKSLDQLRQPLASGSVNPGVNPAPLASFADTFMSTAEEFLMHILAFLSDGVQFLLEYGYIVTALALPLAIYISFTPMGVQGLAIWMIAMSSLGMVKFYYNVSTAIAANVLINSNGAMHLVFGFVTGILSPILAYVLAGGGGIAIMFAVLQFASFAANNGGRRAYSGR